MYQAIRLIQHYRSSLRRSYALFNRNNGPVKISMKIDASESDHFGFLSECAMIYRKYIHLLRSDAEQSLEHAFLFMYNETGSNRKELNFTHLSFRRIRFLT
jgi:beta-fructofuranosidase